MNEEEHFLDDLPDLNIGRRRQPVYYIKVRCPVCNSDKCPVTSTQPPIRYHKCKCGHRFKSIEKN